MIRLTHVLAVVAVVSQPAWAAPQFEESPGLFVNLLVKVFPWLVIFLVLWFFVFRMLKTKAVDRTQIEENLKRSMVHMDRTERQNQRIIELLELIAGSSVGAAIAARKIEADSDPSSSTAPQQPIR